MRMCLQSKSRGEAFFLILINSYVSICEMGVDLLPSYCTSGPSKLRNLRLRERTLFVWGHITI